MIQGNSGIGAKGFFLTQTWWQICRIPLNFPLGVEPTRRQESGASDTQAVVCWVALSCGDW
jgi:hypothetical protein